MTTLWMLAEDRRLLSKGGKRHIQQSAWTVCLHCFLLHSHLVGGHTVGPGENYTDAKEEHWVDDSLFLWQAVWSLFFVLEGDFTWLHSQSCFLPLNPEKWPGWRAVRAFILGIPSKGLQGCTGPRNPPHGLTLSMMSAKFRLNMPLH